ncbi:LysR substrate-binding domain-containing protein [Elstera cyanobacteriorum]|uniref:LysR substrate-binding domain-containing protein n=1 Tax=Elstera cyanobacteriorum TaxID=2022747 RepID=UPI0023539648|nr:LysR substrate-binding domain-containing protein [Elstera cyanobacteriorum]MCK6441581.1 LysR substrate-binding domain-containing protein [Elstera cyanobacteriorum]
MRPTLDIDLLRCFVATVDHASLTLAGDKLGRSQPAVTAQIKRLEEMLGRRLLTRGRNGAHPTEDGVRLLGHARRLLRDHDAALDDLLAIGAEGLIRFGVPDDYEGPFVTPLVAEFTRAQPRVALEVHCACSQVLRARLAVDQLDLVLCTRLPGAAEGQLIRREPLQWVGAADHRLEDRRPLPLALFTEDCAFRPHAFDALDRAGIPWRIAYTGSSFAGILSAVSAGLAVTVLARGTIPPGFRLLGEAEGLPPLPKTDIALYQRDNLSPAARLFARHVIGGLGVEAAQA